MALLPSFQNYTPWGSSKLLFLCAFKAHACTPHLAAATWEGWPQDRWAPNHHGDNGGGTSWALPPANGLFWPCLDQTAEAATLNFSPLALSSGFHHSSTALPPPVGAATFQRAAPCAPPEPPAFRGLTGVLARALVHGTPTPCQQGWPVPSVWAGRAEGAGTDLLSHGTWGFSWWLQKPVCRFSEGKEVIQKLHAYFWIHSLRGVCLSSSPLGSVCIAGILSQSYRIIPSSPQATACQWSPQSLARQPGHMKSYTQRFNAFSWPQPLFVWIPCSVFLTRCQGSFALSRVLRRWLFSCRISTLLELSPEL